MPAGSAQEEAMADLLGAATKQVQYAQNELKSGDKAKALEHMNKALAFIQRAAGSTAEAPPGDTADTGPLSDDMAEAQQQLLKRIGVSPNASWPEIKAAATDKQARELAFLGVAGQPGTYPDADYSLFQEYYEPSSPPAEDSGLQSWAPKAEWAASGSGWKHYNQNR